MSKKGPSVASLKTRLTKAGVTARSVSKVKDFGLLEHGLMFVLMRELTEKQAEATVRSLRAAWPDWNELRVSQVQEIVASMKSKSDTTSIASARLTLEFLQDVFLNNHGFDLEFVEKDLGAGGKALASWPSLGIPGAHFLQWIAGAGVLPVTAGLVRVFDRLGLVERTTSYKKGLDQLEKLGPAKGVGALEFSLQFGIVAEKWCDARKPLCHDCPLVEECPTGKKNYLDWKASQERLAIQRAKEDERERKRLEAEAKREAKKKAEADKKAAAEAKKREEKAKLTAEAKKEAEAKKKAAKKAPTKAAASKPTPKAGTKKATKKVTKKATKKTASKPATAKKATKKPAAPKPAKKVTKKAAKKTTKKVAKKTTKKAATKKASKKSGK